MNHAQPAYSQPDTSGHFGRFGGRFMPEALVAPLDELDRAWTDAKADPAFMAELDRMLRDRKSTRLNSSHLSQSRMPSSA